MLEYIPYIALIINFLGFALRVLKFIFDEKRARRKEIAERLDKLKEAENEKSAFPPRKETHSKH
ncbi:hypothetical protein AV545_04265 [Paenibacillus jamilae]|uniref:hypothetical protein n=1 Tax=Paenibacillus jamilae TaxID=114136 RepID=UPI0007ABF09C|nr:hypothetical protein [Paenibacillus jamilae]KZE65145.1 hypothetical protein AV545_04265 [Paenibacillus jamilae]